MARRTERVLKQGQYVLATDLWYMTEVVLEEECRAIDFYNVQYDIAYSGGISAKKAKILGNARARDYAYELMVNYRRLSSVLVDEDDDETPTPLPLNTMMRTIVHPALRLPDHVVFQSQSNAVFDTLAEDFMKPVVDVVERVLNETTVNVAAYNGQLDLICSTPGTVKWISDMNWAGKKQYASATRHAISVNGLLEGYVRKYGRFSMYWVRV
jgi:serine carboxypeptidase 1